MMPFVPWTAPQRRRAADASTLLGLAAAGDEGALAELYRREAAPVYRYALALAGNPAWAADATHDAFVALVGRPAAFDATQGTLGAYLAGIARHALLAQWRSQRREEPLAEGDEPGDGAAPADVADSPEARLVRAQDGAAVRDALRRLPPIFREVLVLVDLQERPYAEAARIAGIEINTLRTRLHRGRERLARLLGAPDRSPR